MQGYRSRRCKYLIDSISGHLLILNSFRCIKLHQFHIRELDPVLAQQAVCRLMDLLVQVGHYNRTNTPVRLTHLTPAVRSPHPHHQPILSSTFEHQEPTYVLFHPLSCLTYSDEPIQDLITSFLPVTPPSSTIWLTRCLPLLYLQRNKWRCIGAC